MNYPSRKILFFYLKKTNPPNSQPHPKAHVSKRQGSSKLTCSVMLSFTTRSLLITLIALFSPVSTSLAKWTLPKVPSPRTLPNSYFPTRFLKFRPSRLISHQSHTKPQITKPHPLISILNLWSQVGRKTAIRTKPPRNSELQSPWNRKREDTRHPNPCFEATDGGFQKKALNSIETRWWFYGRIWKAVFMGMSGFFSLLLCFVSCKDGRGFSLFNARRGVLKKRREGHGRYLLVFGMGGPL